ncbi:VOC family protein [Rhizobium sp. B21/90]|uniref:VOC family protein n=1 Tax=Rhizobium sp. B21/90 TaxID=2819993 RepID=UPI001C5B787B|nr:VOC family protein [Rhizobium sp. B21/90]QYA04525.1 VOC family protein [Rhizobium sp. B21/90]
MLHHISFGVANIERSAAFYDAAFEPIGYVRVWEDLVPGDPDQAIGYGLPGGGDKFTIKLRGEDAQCPGAGFHLAFTAPSRSAVTLFHKAAMDYGGLDNGPPGLRAHYGPSYFAAFVIDPDGHRVEAVCKEPE